MRKWSECPSCGSTDYRVIYTHNPGMCIDGHVVKCRACSLLYKIPLEENFDATNANVKEYTGNFIEDDDIARAELSEILDILCHTRGDRRGDLLELGCGPGNFLSLAKDRGFNVTGVEATDELAVSARQKTGGTIVVGDIINADLGGATFDVIVLLDLIEHLQDPVEALSRYHDCLNEAGSVLVFTPNHSSFIARITRVIRAITLGVIKKPCDEIFDCLHVTFFNRQTLGKTLERAGYEVTTTKMVAYRPERRNLATGLTASILRFIEIFSRYFPNGPFRVVMMARPKTD
ncbi:MAG: class I SAM-dependent methyltransferase [Rhodospirillaceae bacterium]|nr:class I SAM-dependent methyltransferase [Rhodospirillaceae bacterium]